MGCRLWVVGKAFPPPTAYHLSKHPNEFRDDPVSLFVELQFPRWKSWIQRFQTDVLVFPAFFGWFLFALIALHRISIGVAILGQNQPADSASHYICAENTKAAIRAQRLHRVAHTFGDEHIGIKFSHVLGCFHPALLHHFFVIQEFSRGSA